MNSYNCGGYVLLPVVMAISLIAAISFMLNRTASINITAVSARTETVRARYVAKAGVAHAKWFLSEGCQDTSINNVPFQGHIYDVNIQKEGSLYHIAAVGNLNSGVGGTVETDMPCGDISQKLYWSEIDSRKIWAADLDGNNPVEITTKCPQGNISFTIDSENEMLYWRASNQLIRGITIDDSGEIDFIIINCGVDCKSNGITVDPGNKIYWTNSNKKGIFRVNIDGSEFESLLSKDDGIKAPIGIALDLNAGKMYWADESLDVIQNANLDGTEISTVISGLSSPEYIAIDPAESKIYWFEQDLMLLRKANLDGTNIETIIIFTTNQIMGLALDTENDKIYWTNDDSNTIDRANLDGSSIETLVNQTDLRSVAVRQ